MSREGLMDDCGYNGFEECPKYESCTNDFVAELLEPYDSESIEQLVRNAYEKGRADMKTDIVAMLEREFRIQNNPNSKFEETIVLKRSIIKRILGKGDNDED